MPYTVEFTKGAQRHFEALESEVARRVLAAVGILRDSPRSQGCIKLAGEQNLYRMRAAGTYRIIYEIDDRMRRVLVLKILHRREAYR